MYHTANIKGRISQMHMPGHVSSVNMKKLLRDERFWASLATVALVASFILFCVWAAHNGSAIEGAA